MKSSTHFISKQYIYIYLILGTLIFPSCSGRNREPGIELNSGVNNEVASQVQEPYPAQVEEAQAAYPGITLNEMPSSPTPLPTSMPPSPCDIELPTEIAMQYQETLSDLPEFSQPTVIATNGVGFSIAEWLPDNQRLLVSQGDGAFGSVSTLDVTTGEMVEYVQRRDVSSFPIWLNEAQGIMYVEITTAGWELRFSDGQTVTTLADELASTWLAKDLLSEQVAALFSSEPGGIMTVDPMGQTEFVTAVQLDQETKRVPLSSSDGYHLSWSPDGNWLAQYKGEDLFLINTQTQTICSVDLGDYGEAGSGQIFSVEWSPNSRYLSMGVKRQKGFPELNLLDIDSMEISILPLETETWPPDRIGRRAWSPDSQMIFLQIGKLDNEIGRTMAQWLLIDIQAHQYTRILPDYEFLPGVGDIVWSSDGSKVAYSCPTFQNGNICLIYISQ